VKHARELKGPEAEVERRSDRDGGRGAEYVALKERPRIWQQESEK